jgi:hypothetical protein
MLPARPGQAHGRLLCGVACLPALCSCCRGWVVLRAIIFDELTFWLCCLVTFECCKGINAMFFMPQCACIKGRSREPARAGRFISQRMQELHHRLAYASIALNRKGHKGKAIRLHS